MAETTAIEWADATANFWIGCTKLSLACDNCYAESDWDHRKHRVTWGPHGDRDMAKAGPIVCRKVQRGAAAFIAKHGRQPRIFVNSLSDFGDNHKSIRPEWREAVWHAARTCPDVILMILTKRPQNIPAYLPADWGSGYPNVWIGVTAENQTEADRRRAHLEAIPAAEKFVSYEPALGPVDWAGWEFLSWLISGGESGCKARPSHPDWFRAARDFCAAHGIAYLHKQWGEWLPEGQFDSTGFQWAPGEDGRVHWWKPEPPYGAHLDDAHCSVRVGKKIAGRMLDAFEHNATPWVPYV
ncbi:DUF5131 family protein [Novosphingobium naphthalenivorans]|uniref:DUF5131 family protein n=1 Tax=Novosphingobium naphthalenivorans TaxID=273168 RepID=UPI00082A266C|nr:DUF5131 family protein [Novosphingobium naphthalenivorans]